MIPKSVEENSKAQQKKIDKAIAQKCSESTETKGYTLSWVPFDKHTVPHEKTLLFETEKFGGGVAYHTGIFTLNGQGGPYGVVGGRFYSDCKIRRYADISDLLPEV